MKRIAIFLSLLFLFTLCACGKKEEKLPEDTIVRFSDAMRSLDAEAMKECLLNPDNDELLADLGLDNESVTESEEDAIMELSKSKSEKWAKNLQYEIVNVDRDGDRAKVTVKYSYVDASPIVQEIIKEIFTKAYDGSLDYFSEEEIDDYLELMIKEKLVTTTVAKSEETVQYQLVKVNGEWVIADLPSEVYDISTMNLHSAAKEIDLLFSDSTGNDISNGLGTTEPVTASTPVPEPMPEPTPAPAPAAESPFEIARKYIDRPLDELTAVIGQPLSSVYGPSCLIPGGQDGQLQYDGFWIYTVKDGDTETVKDVLEGQA